MIKNIKTAVEYFNNIKSLLPEFMHQYYILGEGVIKEDILFIENSIGKLPTSFKQVIEKFSFSLFEPRFFSFNFGKRNSEKGYKDILIYENQREDYPFMNLIKGKYLRIGTFEQDEILLTKDTGEIIYFITDNQEFIDICDSTELFLILIANIERILNSSMSISEAETEFNEILDEFKIKKNRFWKYIFDLISSVKG